jgi:acyl-CoA thioesterase-1
MTFLRLGAIQIRILRRGVTAITRLISRGVYAPRPASDGLARALMPVLLGFACAVSLLIPSSDARDIRLVALGDSLTAGYNLPEAAAFPSRLQAALRSRGRTVTVINAGVSGDTSQGGLDRLDWSVGDGVDGVILELGANDALRGLDPAQTRANLDAIIRRLTERRIPVLLAGMRAPPNMGPDYASRFDGLFPELARQHDLVFYPFFLDGVAARPELNQRDGIHPTAQGVDVIVERILPTVERFLDRIGR